jgi:hypothetical protein
MIATSLLEHLLNPGIIWVFIPLTAIALGGILSLSAMIIKHRERMAKIGMGIDPDAPAHPYRPLDQQLSDSTPRF